MLWLTLLADEDSFCLVTSNHGLSGHIELLLHEIAIASWPQMILNQVIEIEGLELAVVRMLLA